MTELTSHEQQNRVWLRCPQCGYSSVIITEMTVIDGEVLVPILCRTCHRLFEIPVTPEEEPFCPISDNHNIEFFSAGSEEYVDEELEADLDEIFGTESRAAEIVCCECPKCGKQLKVIKR